VHPRTATGSASGPLPEGEVVDDEYARLPEQPPLTRQPSSPGMFADQISERIRQDPLAAAAAAAVVGFVVGLLLAR
jgi:hypothetical protein